jgi:nitrate reductase alpha subunit
MVSLFPSILPPDATTYDRDDLRAWDWHGELRPLAAALPTDAVSGKSTQPEVVQYLHGHFTAGELRDLRAQINSDAPELEPILTASAAEYDA